ncbi:MAG: type II secretion system F family protein [Pseudobdellovibrionaceae bacterium]
MNTTQIALIIILVLVILFMAYMFVRADKQRRYEQRMAIISGQKDFGTKGSKISVQDKRRADLAKKLKGEQTGKERPRKEVLKARLELAGIQNPSIGKFWMLSALSCLIGTGLMLLLGMGGIAVIFTAIFFLLGFPRFVLSRMIARRQKKFLEDFADALEAMMRLLKAGMPVGEAILMVSREFTGPVGEEMSRVYEEQKVGIPLSEAVFKAAERMPLTEMQMFATGITIQQQTGSSLSEILQNLATVIRARFRLKRKVAALSAEAKASAAIIGSLPILVATGMYFINHDYMILLFTTPTGKMLTTGAVCWMCMGVLVMKQMINFKV